ncbi:MAG: hypothetical protein AAGI28_06520 [Pseudomonadota bacterium]
MIGCNGTLEPQALDNTATSTILQCATDRGVLEMHGVSDALDTVIFSIDEQVRYEGEVNYSPNGKFHAYFDIGEDRHSLFYESGWAWDDSNRHRIMTYKTGYLVERDGKISDYLVCSEDSEPMDLAALQRFSVPSDSVFRHGEAISRFELLGEPFPQ